MILHLLASLRRHSRALRSRPNPADTSPAAVQRAWNLANQAPTFGPPLGSWPNGTWLQKRREMMKVIPVMKLERIREEVRQEIQTEWLRPNTKGG
mgnify:CR=1 FL=1